jgi:RNA polymerase sigma-54 factor
MALEQKLNLRLSQRLVMTPSLQQAIKLLQMSKLELEEVLTQEMVENPRPRGESRRRPARGEEPSRPKLRGARGRQGRRQRPRRRLDGPRGGAAEGEAPAEKERDSFDEIDFDSYFEDYLDTALQPEAVRRQRADARSKTRFPAPRISRNT